MMQIGVSRKGEIRLDFNENHDPHNGEFSSGPGGSSSEHRVQEKGDKNFYQRHSSLEQAKEGARISSLHSSKAFEVRDKGQASAHPNGKLVTSFKGGKEIGSTAKAAPSYSGHTQLSEKQFTEMVQKGSFSVLTPANPMSQASSTKENAGRMRAAIKELDARGVKWVATVGRYGNPEPGFMVFHDEKFGVKEARELGKKWNQTSVLHSEAGKATIAHVNGKFAGLVQRSTGLSFNPKATDNYTGRGGVKFSFSFPDESWDHPEKE